MPFTRIEAVTSGFGWKSDLEAVGVAVAGAAVEAGDFGVIGSTFSITLWTRRSCRIFRPGCSTLGAGDFGAFLVAGAAVLTGFFLA